MRPFSSLRRQRNSIPIDLFRTSVHALFNESRISARHSDKLQFVETFHPRTCYLQATLKALHKGSFLVRRASLLVCVRLGDLAHSRRISLFEGIFPQLLRRFASSLLVLVTIHHRMLGTPILLLRLFHPKCRTRQSIGYRSF